MKAITELDSQWGRQFAVFIEEVREAWKTTEGEATAEKVKRAMERLFQQSSLSEPWVIALRDEKQTVELYRDEEFGFIQMGHYHNVGHASPPHDHGNHWVVYGIYKGDIEIATYDLQPTSETLKVTERHHLTDGDANVYVPGEIHSTRQLSPEGSVVLRFLSADLKKVKRSHYNWEQVE